MTVQIIINGENAAESLLELSTLAAGLGQSSEKVSSLKVNTSSEVKQKTVKESAASKEKPVEVESNKEDSATPSTSEEVEIKIEDLRALCKEKNTSTEQNKLIKATIAKYGGGGLPNVPESDYAALKAELESL